MFFKSLCKGNANREKSKMNLFIFYSEMQLSLCKGNANMLKKELFSFIFIKIVILAKRRWRHSPLYILFKILFSFINIVASAAIAARGMNEKYIR